MTAPSAKTGSEPAVRLHKYLATCGVASRRKAEDLILEGRVKVNGRLVRELGVKITPGRDRVTVNGKGVHPEARAYYLLHKPRGYVVTAKDERERRTVMELLPGIKQRVFPVGRLDRESEGLLVMTNDGSVAYYLTHPSCGVRKTYRVCVEGSVAEGVPARMVERGVKLGPIKVKPLACKILRRRKHETEIEIVVGEGINREVRRIFAALGHEVKRLTRTRIGSLELRGLPRGRFRELRRKELEGLLRDMRAAAKNETGAVADDRRRAGSRYFRQPGKRLGKPDPAAGGRSPRRGGKTAPAGDNSRSGDSRQGAAKRPAAKRGRTRHPLA